MRNSPLQSPGAFHVALSVALGSGDSMPESSMDLTAVLGTPLPDFMLNKQQQQQPLADDLTESSSSSPHSSSPPYHMPLSPQTDLKMILASERSNLQPLDTARRHPAALGLPADAFAFDAAVCSPAALLVSFSSGPSSSFSPPAFHSLLGNVISEFCLPSPGQSDDGDTLDMPVDNSDELTEEHQQFTSPHSGQESSFELAVALQRKQCLQRQAAIEHKLAQFRQYLRRQQQRVTAYHARSQGAGPRTFSGTEGDDTQLIAYFAAEKRTSALKAVPEHRTNLAHSQLYRRQLEFLHRETDPAATDSSSCVSSDEGEDEIFFKLDRKRRKVQARYDRARADVGWRWSWLRNRVGQLEDDMQACRLAAHQARQAKDALFQAESEAVQRSCARAAVTAVPGKRRKLCHPPAPSMASPVPTLRSAVCVGVPLSDPHAIQMKSAIMDRGFHPVLSFPSDAPYAVLAAARRHRRALHHQHEADKHERKHHGGTLSAFSPAAPFSATLETPLEGAPRERQVSSVGRLDMSPRPCAVNLGSFGSSFRRRRPTVDLAIDDIMLPPQLAPSHVVPLCVKEIVTPSWCTAQTAADATEALPQAPSVLMAAEPAQEEDTSDAVYQRLHQPYETREISSFLSAVALVAQGSVRRSSLDSPDAPPAKRMRSEVRAIREDDRPTYPARTFPLTGSDEAELNLALTGFDLSVMPIYTVISQDLGDTLDDMGTSLEQAATLAEERPIKLVLKLTGSAINQ